MHAQSEILTQDRYCIERRHNSKRGKSIGGKVGRLPDTGEYKTTPPGFGMVEGALIFSPCESHVAVFLKATTHVGKNIKK